MLGSRRSSTRACNISSKAWTVSQVGDVGCQRMDSSLGHSIPLRPLPTGKGARPALPPHSQLPKRWPFLTSLKPGPAPLAGQRAAVGTGQFLPTNTAPRGPHRQRFVL